MAFADSKGTGFFVGLPVGGFYLLVQAAFLIVGTVILLVVAPPA